MPEMDILQPLPMEEWPSLRDLYRNNWPYTIYPYYIVQNWINWKKKDDTVNVNIFCPRGSWKEGTMVVAHEAEYGLTLYVFTLEKDCYQLQEALKKTSAINWSLGPYFYAIHQDHWEAVKGSLLYLGLGSEFTIQSGYHWISKEQAANFDIVYPPDVYIAPLSEDDIPSIDAVWPHRHPGSDGFLKQLLQHNGGLGLYLKEDHTLCSWIMKNQHLGLGVLQTQAAHKRKGYGRLVTMALTKKMAEEGVDIHTCIVRQNVVSQTLFKSLGFKHVDHLMFDKVQPFNKDQNFMR